jgi:hypothetical protein
MKFSTKIKSIKDAITLKSPTLGDFRRKYGQEFVIKYISQWIISVNDMLSLKNGMTESQIIFTANRIYDTYSLKITDLTLFFRNFIEGIYGSFYERLSPQQIMDAIKLYFNERCEIAENISHNEKVNINQIEVHPEVIKEMFKGVGEEKIQYDTSKIIIKKKSLIEALILTKTYHQLRDYLILNSPESKTFNKSMFMLVQNELEKRLIPPNSGELK